MLIPVRGAGHGCPVAEWAMIELQGKLEQQHDPPAGQNLTVGTLMSSPTEPGVVHLLVGHHLLEGKRVALKMPLALLERRPAAPVPADDAAADGDASSPAFRVVGVVRHKYLFKTRPRALITKPHGRA